MPPELSLEDLTPQARTILEQATQTVTERATSSVEPRHLLFALLNGNNLATEELSKGGVDPKQMRKTLEAQLPLGDPTKSKPASLGPEMQRVVRSAFKEAVHLGHRRVDALHLLLGLLYLNDDPAAKLLTEAGVSLYQLRQTVLEAPKRFQTRQRDTLRANVRPSPIFFGLVAVMVVCGAALWLNPGEMWTGPVTNLFIISGWIVSLCLHEFGHALTAYLGGDTSVGEAGYLTLNPLRYTHPLLSIVFPLLILLTGGLGLPGGAVYIRTGALRSTLWEALVSAAGPFGTLLFCLLITIPFYFDWMQWAIQGSWYFWPALAFLGFLQVTSLLFNLLPIPPLDGFQLLATQLPPALRQQLLALGNIGFFLLFFLFRSNNPITEAFWNFAFTTAARFHIPIELISAGYYQFAWWNT
jgi:Zn-dependent protease